MEHSYESGDAPELERELRQRGYSRRDIMKLAGALGVAGLLAACGSVKQQTTQSQQGSTKSIYSSSDADGLQWPKTVVAEPTSPVQLSISHAWDATFMARQQQFDQL